MDTSSFSEIQNTFPDAELLPVEGSTCDCYRVHLYGKLHFLKRLKPEFRTDPRYVASLQKEFEIGYRLEHPHLVRYISKGEDYLLTEYVDGETLSQFAANHPDYFTSKNNTNRFLSQLLDVLGYLHSHQVVHLDLKPDNILITRIGNDVKLTDLGYCYTDTYTDTMGRTDKYAAPEQFPSLGKEGPGVVAPPDARTDIYAVGKILETLPCPTIYNKVKARCTAKDPSIRYQSVDEILHDINHQKRYYRYVALFVAVVAVLAVCIALLTHQQDAAPVIQESPMDSIAPIQKNSVALPEKNQDVKPHNTIPQDQRPAPMVSLTESQRHEIRHYALRVIRPVYERMIVPVVKRINRGEYNEKIMYVRDSLDKVFVATNEEVRAVFRKDAIENRYPHVSPLEVSNEENNAIGDVMHYYDQLIMHHQTPGIKIPPNPFEE